MIDRRLPLVSMMVLIGCSTDSGVGAELQGTVEVRTVDVAPLVAGRVTTMLVDEGDWVEAGDTVAILTAPSIAADLDAAQAWVRMAEATLADLRAGSRPQEIQRLEAELTAAEIEATRLATERERASSLWQAGAIAEREYDVAVSAANVAAERMNAASENLSLARAGVRAGQISVAQAEVQRARASLASREAANLEYVLLAPIDGVVLSRISDPGDLLRVGSTAITVGQTREPWVRIFVPARVLPTINIGDEVDIHPPGAGGAGTTWPGRIIAINPQAEYVTRTALTEEERADLLFGVKVAVLDTTGSAKPGLPVTVTLPESDQAQ